MSTSVAILTPPGSAALATLALVGDGAWPLVRAAWRGGALPESPDPHQFWFGKVGDEVIADEVVLCAPPGRVEIHCHGGRQVVDFLCDYFQMQGATIVPWQDLEIIQGTPPEQVQLLDDLTRAPTLRTAKILLEMLAGTRPNDAALRRHLVEPWRMVVAGAPNVGKSSLINALAGFTRSLVSPTPGTTRDLVSVRLAIDGWPVEFIDTAGLRESGDPLEEAGITRARAAAQNADFVLWIVDGSTAPILPEREDTRTLMVINKVDQPPAWDWSQIPGAALVSASQGTGIHELCRCIAQELHSRIGA